MSLTNESIKWLFADRSLAFMSLATATCVIYDHLTTLDEEIELVWKRPKWTMVQFLFFVNRYVGDVGQIYAAYAFVEHIVHHNNKNCNFINIFIGYTTTTISCAMQGIMIFRVSSMYNHDRRIITLLGCGFVLEWLAAILIQVLSYGVYAPIPDPAPGVQLCIQKSFPHWMYAIWIPIACFEGLILLLSLCRGFTYYKWSQESRRLKLSTSMNPYNNSLGYILLRDSIAFPFICVTLCLVNLFVWINLPHLAVQMAFCFASFAPCIIGPRLILNLREAYYQPFIQELNGQYDDADHDLDDLAGPHPSWADDEVENGAELIPSAPLMPSSHLASLSVSASASTCDFVELQPLDTGLLHSSELHRHHGAHSRRTPSPSHTPSSSYHPPSSTSLVPNSSNARVPPLPPRSPPPHPPS